MKLSEKRAKFSTALARLILYANCLGYDVAVDFVKRCKECEVGKANSVHKSGLAADINLYLKGEWITYPEPFSRLHDFWELYGGAKRIDGDLNHFSFEHNGMR